jgi:flagellar P-ring protein precursor FlgI
MVQVLKQNFPELKVRALHAGKVAVSPVAPEQAMMLIAQIQQLRVQTASIARVVVNEKTGTVVAGADVTIGDVVISHAGIRLEIQTRFRTSQPGAFSGINNPAVRTETVPETDVKIAGEREAYYASQGGTNIAELVAALKKVNLSTRDIISILQAINQSGALNAELIVQ